MVAINLANPALTAFFLLIRLSDAFWRLECDGSVGLARLDPLMDFGGLSDHVHTIKGGSAFTASATGEDLLKSKCQSCGVQQDKSAYWTPPLYFMADDGTTTLVPEKPPFKAYYELNTGSTSDGKQQTVEAFPNGFQMISGNNYNRNSTLSGDDPSTFVGPFTDEDNYDREQRAIGFNCMNYGRAGLPAKDEPTLYRHHLPEKSWLDANCPDGLRLELQFPSCWNGNMDGGEKHKSHVAFPNWINGGDCPAGFDRRLPSLMYETIYATDQFIGKGGTFVISNGDTTGYGYHGDFMSAWDEGVLEQAISQCTDMSGEMKACGVFKFPDNTASCELENPLPAEIAHENVSGPMQGLPAGMEVSSGPEPASKGQGSSGTSSGGKSGGSSGSSESSVVPPPPPPAPPSSSAPLPSPSASSVMDNSQSEGGVYAQVKDKAAAAPAPAITSPPADPAPVAEPANVVSTVTYTENGVVHKNLVVLEETTVTEGAKAKRTPGAVAEHAKRHAHRHHHLQHGIGGRRLR